VTDDRPLIARLAEHLQRPVPESVRTRARLHLLDWLACVAGARGSEVAEVFRGDDRAYLGNLLEMDDVHRVARLHPGPVVWPTAILGTATRGASLDSLLDAAVRGYEAMILVGETLDDHHYARWHPTATAGVFGAAACSAFTWELDTERLVWALGNAGSIAGGLWHMRHDDVMTKQLHLKLASINGRSVATAAMYGVTGPSRILEGPQGVYAAMTQTPKPMRLVEGWRIEEVSFKPWAACRHAHAAIDCALELRAAGRLTAPFHIETYADALTFCDMPNPTTSTEAKFSLQHAVAVIADGRNATPRDFTSDSIAALADLRAKVTVAEAPEITARYPAHFGARLNGFELIDTRGDPERPVSEADIVAKFRMLAASGGVPESTATTVERRVLKGKGVQALSDSIHTLMMAP